MVGKRILDTGYSKKKPAVQAKNKWYKAEGGRYKV
jgi:hypothetical protein